MWLARLALGNPYGVAVFALLILLFGGTALTRLPTDILGRLTPALLTTTR